MFFTSNNSNSNSPKSTVKSISTPAYPLPLPDENWNKAEGYKGIQVKPPSDIILNVKD